MLFRVSPDGLVQGVTLHLLETGYKNNLAIRIVFPRTKSCNLSIVCITYKNKLETRPFSSGIKVNKAERAIASKALVAQNG